MMLIALTAATQLSVPEDQFEQCVNYFLSGQASQFQLAGAVIAVGIFLYTAFTKKNLPGMFKTGASWLMNQRKATPKVPEDEPKK